MKFAKKDFKDYWKIIKIPTLVLIGWSALAFIVSIISFDLYVTIFTPLVGWVLMLLVFGFIGWTTIKDHKETVKISAWAGALSGAISGFAGAVISILMFYLVPDIVDYALAQAGQAGASAAAVQSFMAIGMYIGLVTGPLVSGIVAAIITVIVAFIARKV